MGTKTDRPQVGDGNTGLFGDGKTRGGTLQAAGSRSRPPGRPTGSTLPEGRPSRLPRVPPSFPAPPFVATGRCPTGDSPRGTITISPVPDRAAHTKEPGESAGNFSA